MRRSINVLTIVLVCLFAATVCGASDAKPALRIPLHLDLARMYDDVTVRFSHTDLIVYEGWGKQKHPILVFHMNSGNAPSNEPVASLSLPPWDECPRTEFREPFPAANIVDCRKQMVIEQIGGIGLLGPTEPAQFYVEEPGREKTLIFRAYEKCQPGDPKFISDDLILLRQCHNDVVVNKKGKHIYKLPKLADCYVTPSADGTRFAVYERDASFFSEIEGRTDKLRVRVFRTSDGHKVFDHRWHAGHEAINDGRVALSDDGLLLAFMEGDEVLVFRLP